MRSRALALALVVLAAHAACRRRYGPETCDPGQSGQWTPSDQRPQVTGKSAGCPGVQSRRGLQKGTVSVDGHERTLRAAPRAAEPVPGDCGARPLATMIIHATNDPTVPFGDGAAAEHMWSTAAGCPATTNPVPGAWPCVAHDGCASRAPVLLCAHREYHSWPSFAAPAIWAFFDGLR